MKPTQKQAELLYFIEEYTLAHFYQPSITEMADEFGVARNAIQDKLKALQTKGLIKLGEGDSRCIELFGLLKKNEAMM